MWCNWTNLLQGAGARTSCCISCTCTPHTSNTTLHSKQALLAASANHHLQASRQKQLPWERMVVSSCMAEHEL